MIRCIAIDDEPLALEQLKSYIGKIPFLELVCCCQDAFKAMEVLSKEKIDAIFADINMPDLNGMDFIRSLINPPMVIFTTAYSEYAVDGYKVDAIDYLLKPFGFQEFQRSAQKLLKQWEYENTNNTTMPEDNSLFIKTEYKIVRVRIADIRYIESMSEYLRLYVENEPKPFMTLLSMKKLEDRLPGDKFMRVHRSYIVNLHKIVEISRSRIVMDKNTYIPVGDNYKEKFAEYLDKMYIKK